MPNWSLFAHGAIEDAEKAAHFLEELRALFSSTELGTTSTSYTAGDLQEANFHAVAPAPADSTPVPAETPPAGADAGESAGDTPGEGEPAAGTDDAPEPRDG